MVLSGEVRSSLIIEESVRSLGKIRVLAMADRQWDFGLERDCSWSKSTRRDRGDKEGSVDGIDGRTVNRLRMGEDWADEMEFSKE